MMRCSTFDEEAFTTFSEDYRGDAPEAEFFPLDSLQPGRADPRAGVAER